MSVHVPILIVLLKYVHISPSRYFSKWGKHIKQNYFKLHSIQLYNFLPITQPRNVWYSNLFAKLTLNVLYDFLKNALMNNILALWENFAYAFYSIALKAQLA